MPVQTPQRTMIVGYDGTDASRSALKEAVRLAGPDDRVEVIYVYEPVSAIMGRPFYDQALRERQYTGRQVLREATELVAGAEHDSVVRDPRGRNRRGARAARPDA